MDWDRNLSEYESTQRFDPERVQAAAVYCSDGRFSAQVDELLNHALRLPRYDRLAVPGGAACLAGHFPTFREEQGVVEQLRFLVSAHKLQLVVLIAHQDCAFYTERLHIPSLRLETTQREDMHKAIRRVRSLGHHLTVQAFFARKRDRTIRFELVEA